MSVKVISNAKALSVGDKGFTFTDGVGYYPRAAIAVSDECPQSYKNIIETCRNNGWIEAVAYVPTKEYIWDVLEK